MELGVEVEAGAVDVAALRGDLERALGAVVGRRSSRSRVTVLGAGQDDLEPGRGYLSALAAGGWSVPGWPRDLGGRGATPDAAAVIAKLLTEFEQPDLYPFLVGLNVVGPTLLDLATDAQRRMWLPTIAAGDEIWCQLFSEPGAGSDLAGLATRAVRDGLVWRVTGQKVWTSRAHYAHLGFLLARTDDTVAKHVGITAFALDMRAPGVEIRPLRQMNGDAHFSEVFLDDVVVADHDRIGDLGHGWMVAKTALAHERGAASGVGGGLALPVDRMLALVDPGDIVRRDRALAVHVDAEVARLTNRRAREALRAGRTPGPEGSGAKLRGSATFKAAAHEALGLLGPASMATEPGARVEGDDWPTLFLTAPSISIRGGTDEIQRTIVGERVLGLPAEPRVDTDRPFRDQPG